MDYVCCVTGKSPSTTGAGSEGALSKGPFNAIGATADLNNMLVSMILTDYGGFSSAAGWIACGLKTRTWPETIGALKNMVEATHIVHVSNGLA